VQRAFDIKRAGTWPQAQSCDTILLDADERQRRRIVLTGERGTQVLLDLPAATLLRDGDGLVLEDGAILRVAARPEPLLEATAENPQELARLAWHLGNRHAEIQVVGGRLRLRRDHVLRQMLVSLGAGLAEVEAPFDPELGAYDAGAHRHGGSQGRRHGPE